VSRAGEGGKVDITTMNYVQEKKKEEQQQAENISRTDSTMMMIRMNYLH
jgi:hypothetical protein